MRRTITSLSTAFVAAAVGLAAGDASAAIGGPDAFGYTFADQDSGAVFNYVDITATGTLVVMADDNFANVALGAPFTIYGVVQNDMTASTNGFLTDMAGGTSDLSNECPIPAPPGAGAGSFRIAALHDDLVTSVRYQYFNEAEAAAVGYAGETAGISIFQWTGNHFSGPAAGIDVEVILFHDDNSILQMINADSDMGSGSTMGIQDPTGSIGLNYGCDTAGYTIPGVTAVQYTLGPAPDSDCCTASPTMAPGCTQPTCQANVCATTPSCCASNWDAACAAQAATDCPITCGAATPVFINEIRVDQTGADDDEYFELVGPPGTLLNNYQYIVLGDFPTGEVEVVIDLSGNVIPPSGYFVVAEGSFSLGVPDLLANLNFENVDTVTHMLVGGFTGNVSDNVDANGDGVFDITPWATVFDQVALVHPPSTDLPYGPPLACMASPTCQEVNDGIDGPFQVRRCPDVNGTWEIGNDDLATVPSTDTPGADNMCIICGNGIVDMGEDCDDSGESAACDSDCTFASCGDGLINMTAGEICDDAGESAACNADCTVAMCGDGVTNMTAGEDCDDAGESATCNADCTTAVCGDGQINMTAGEECDDSGESATCDDDCTAVMCGDSTVNTTAGETCDDGGRSATCNADCTAASCGDGIVNMTAGEECDGDGAGMPGETADCDDDCTNAMCGDGVVNATAGEDCDDMGESDVCDDDCTPAECGDGVANAAAGEECDDGNTEDGDGCAADCTEEAAGSTGGMDTGTGDDTGDTGVDSTGGGEGDTSGGPVTVTITAGDTDGDTEADTDTETGGSVPGDDGCSCSTEGQRGQGMTWLLGLFGLAAIRRRRRSA